MAISIFPCDPARERYVSLATFRRDGREVRTPVWIAASGTRFYVFSEPAVGKVKRIRANGRAAVAACTLRGIVTGPWSPAQARIVTEAAVVECAYTALRAKYGWALRITDFMARLSGRFDQRAMLEIELV